MSNMSEKRKNFETTETSKKQKSELIDQLTLKKQETIFKDMNFHEPVDKETFIKLMHSKQLLAEMPPDAYFHVGQCSATRDIQTLSTDDLSYLAANVTLPIRGHCLIAQSTEKFVRFLFGQGHVRIWNTFRLSYSL